MSGLSATFYPWAAWEARPHLSGERASAWEAGLAEEAGDYPSAAPPTGELEKIYQSHLWDSLTLLLGGRNIRPWLNRRGWQGWRHRGSKALVTDGRRRCGAAAFLAMCSLPHCERILHNRLIDRQRRSYFCLSGGDCDAALWELCGAVWIGSFVPIVGLFGSTGGGGGVNPLITSCHSPATGGSGR